MSFCKFSSSYIIQDKTVVDNIFINDFLPTAPDGAVKVYLMGLSKCANATAPDNNIQNFANVLNMSVEDVEQAFLYWQEQGLVQVLSTKPVEVRYMPLNANLGNVKKYKVNKYTDFNLQIQEILAGRMITPTEYAEYYNVIENSHLEPEALLMIAKYCVDLKGENIRYPYIVAIAKNWAVEGIHTAMDVENKIQELGVLDDKVMLVLSALGTKRKVQLEDVQMLNKWLDEFGFDLNVIVYTAKRISMKKKADMLYLNNVLLKYYEMKLSSVSEIEDYENNKQSLMDTARVVVKNLGLYYDDLTKVIETYVVKWQQMGYSQETLSLISDYSFKSSIRTLEGFDGVVQKLFKLGIVSTDALNEYLDDLLATDSKISTILDKLNIKRNVNAYDRTYYKTWTQIWNFSDDMIELATSLSVDKASAIQYMNKILSNWKMQDIYTVDKAQQTIVKTENQAERVEKPQQSKYTKEELNALFSNLEYSEV